MPSCITASLGASGLPTLELTGPFPNSITVGRPDDARLVQILHFIHQYSGALWVAVWVEDWVASGRDVLFFSVSEDDGVTWSPPTEIVRADSSGVFFGLTMAPYRNILGDSGIVILASVRNNLADFDYNIVAAALDVLPSSPWFSAGGAIVAIGPVVPNPNNITGSLSLNCLPESFDCLACRWMTETTLGGSTCYYHINNSTDASAFVPIDPGVINSEFIHPSVATLTESRFLVVWTDLISSRYPLVYAMAEFNPSRTSLIYGSRQIIFDDPNFRTNTQAKCSSDVCYIAYDDSNGLPALHFALMPLPFATSISWSQRRLFDETNSLGLSGSFLDPSLAIDSFNRCLLALSDPTLTNSIWYQTFEINGPLIENLTSPYRLFYEPLVAPPPGTASFRHSLAYSSDSETFILVFETSVMSLPFKPYFSRFLPGNGSDPWGSAPPSPATPTVTTPAPPSLSSSSVSSPSPPSSMSPTPLSSPPLASSQGPTPAATPSPPSVIVIVTPGVLPLPSYPGTLVINTTAITIPTVVEVLGDLIIGNQLTVLSVNSNLTVIGALVLSTSATLVLSDTAELIVGGCASLAGTLNLTVSPDVTSRVIAQAGCFSSTNFGAINLNTGDSCREASFIQTQQVQSTLVVFYSITSPTCDSTSLSAYSFVFLFFYLIVPN